MNIKKIICCVLIGLAISLVPYELIQGSNIVSVSAQSQVPDVHQSDIQNRLYSLDNLRNLGINEENYHELYNISLEYVALANLAGTLGFSSEKSSALDGAEIALSTILHNTGIFGFFEQDIPARSDTYSSVDGSGFSFGWRWSSSRQTVCSVSREALERPNSALENSASRLLQRVFIEQENHEAALLAAEVGRSITVEKSIFLNAIRRRLLSGYPCELIEDFATRLTVADMKNLATSQNATIVVYSIISDSDDPYLLKYFRDVKRGTRDSSGSIDDFPSNIYMWVIKPNDPIISFKKQPLSTLLDLESFELECSSPEDCRAAEARGLINLVASARETSIENVPAPSNILAPSNQGGTKSQADNTSLDENRIYADFYDLLIEPIARFLPDENLNARVVFVPQGVLNFLPFAALKDSVDPSGKYLIEKYTIITTPNLRHLRLSQQKRDDLEDSSGNALVVGDPTLNLHYSAIEAGEIARILEEQGFDIDDDELLIGSEADRQSVVNRMEDSRIIHIASHGTLEDIGGLELPDLNEILEEDASNSLSETYAQYCIDPPPIDAPLMPGTNDTSHLAILLNLYCSPTAGGSLLLANSSGEEQPNLTAVDILDLDLSETELVVLSACKTGRGPLTPGGVVGLPFSLSIAGVPSIVLSLWDVPDESTSTFMIRFYQYLFDSAKNPQQDKAVALRLAMLSFLQEDPNALPGQWAAFTLVGSAD